MSKDLDAVLSKCLPVLGQHDVVILELLPAVVLSRAPIVVAVAVLWRFLTNGRLDVSATLWPAILKGHH